MTRLPVTDWRPDPGTLPQETAIGVWRMDLRQAAGDPGLLSADERERFQRIRDPVRAARWRNGRAALRLLLGRHLGCSPEEVIFEVSPTGKPRLSGQALHFNLSHSGDLALVAVSRCWPLGIDLERLRSLEDGGRRIARRLLPPDILLRLEQAPHATRGACFFEQWTRLEARQKLSGAGVFGPRLEEQRCRLLSFVPGTGYLAALAWPAEAPDTHPGFFQFDT